MALKREGKNEQQSAVKPFLWHTCLFPKNQMQNTGSEIHQKIPETGNIIKL